MKIEAAEAGRVENRFRQQETVGDDHRRIRIEVNKRRSRIAVPQSVGRTDFQPMRHSELGDRRRLERKSTTLWAGWSGIHAHNIVAMADKLDERRHSEVGRAHEGQAQGHARQSARLLQPLGFRELLERHRALEARQMVDEQDALEVVDLMLQASREQPLGLKRL